jgi:hypothetical protein
MSAGAQTAEPGLSNSRSLRRIKPRPQSRQLGKEVGAGGSSSTAGVCSELAKRNADVRNERRSVRSVWAASAGQDARAYRVNLAKRRDRP